MTIYHVETQKAYDQLAEKLSKEGYITNGGRKPLTNVNLWLLYRDETCIRTWEEGKVVTRDSVSYHKSCNKNLEIVEFKEDKNSSLEILKERMTLRIEREKANLVQARNNPYGDPSKAQSRLGMHENFLYELEQLEEPKTVAQEKVCVPQFVADWYEVNKWGFDFKVFEYCKEWSMHDVDDEFRQWFNDLNNEPIQTLTKMKLFGYTVEEEKEPLYYVNFIDDIICGYLNLNVEKGELFIAGIRECINFRTKFTEKEIKAFNENYWAFAVPVEEEMVIEPLSN